MPPAEDNLPFTLEPPATALRTLDFVRDVRGHAPTDGDGRARGVGALGQAAAQMARRMEARDMGRLSGHSQDWLQALLARHRLSDLSYASPYMHFLRWLRGVPDAITEATEADAATFGGGAVSRVGSPASRPFPSPASATRAEARLSAAQFSTPDLAFVRPRRRQTEANAADEGAPFRPGTFPGRPSRPVPLSPATLSAVAPVPTVLRPEISLSGRVAAIAQTAQPDRMRQALPENIAQAVADRVQARIGVHPTAGKPREAATLPMPLSYPPVPLASWLGVASPAPDQAGLETVPGAFRPLVTPTVLTLPPLPKLPVEVAPPRSQEMPSRAAFAALARPGSGGPAATEAPFRATPDVRALMSRPVRSAPERPDAPPGSETAAAPVPTDDGEAPSAYLSAPLAAARAAMDFAQRWVSRESITLAHTLPVAAPPAGPAWDGQAALGSAFPLLRRPLILARVRPVTGDGDTKSGVSSGLPLTASTPASAASSPARSASYLWMPDATSPLPLARRRADADFAPFSEQQAQGVPSAPIAPLPSRPLAASLLEQLSARHPLPQTVPVGPMAGGVPGADPLAARLMPATARPVPLASVPQAAVLSAPRGVLPGLMRSAAGTMPASLAGVPQAAPASESVSDAQRRFATPSGRFPAELALARRRTAAGDAPGTFGQQEPLAAAAVARHFGERRAPGVTPAAEDPTGAASSAPTLLEQLSTRHPLPPTSPADSSGVRAPIAGPFAALTSALLRLFPGPRRNETPEAAPPFTQGAPQTYDRVNWTEAHSGPDAPVAALRSAPSLFQPLTRWTAPGTTPPAFSATSPAGPTSQQAGVGTFFREAVSRAFPLVRLLDRSAPGQSAATATSEPSGISHPLPPTFAAGPLVEGASGDGPLASPASPLRRFFTRPWEAPSLEVIPPLTPGGSHSQEGVHSTGADSGPAAPMASIRLALPLFQSPPLPLSPSPAQTRDEAVPFARPQHPQTDDGGNFLRAIIRAFPLARLLGRSAQNSPAANITTDRAGAEYPSLRMSARDQSVGDLQQVGRAGETSAPTAPPPVQSLARWNSPEAAPSTPGLTFLGGPALLQAGTGDAFRQAIIRAFPLARLLERSVLSPSPAAPAAYDQPRTYAVRPTEEVQAWADDVTGMPATAAPRLNRGDFGAALQTGRPDGRGAPAPAWGGTLPALVRLLGRGAAPAPDPMETSERVAYTTRTSPLSPPALPILAALLRRSAPAGTAESANTDFTGALPGRTDAGTPPQAVGGPWGIPQTLDAVGANDAATRGAWGGPGLTAPAVGRLPTAGRPFRPGAFLPTVAALRDWASAKTAAASRLVSPPSTTAMLARRPALESGTTHRTGQHSDESGPLLVRRTLPLPGLPTATAGDTAFGPLRVGTEGQESDAPESPTVDRPFGTRAVFPAAATALREWVSARTGDAARTLPLAMRAARALPRVAGQMEWAAPGERPTALPGPSPSSAGSHIQNADGSASVSSGVAGAAPDGRYSFSDLLIRARQGSLPTRRSTPGDFQSSAEPDFDTLAEAVGAVSARTVETQLLSPLRRFLLSALARVLTPRLAESALAADADGPHADSEMTPLALSRLPLRPFGGVEGQSGLPDWPPLASAGTDRLPDGLTLGLPEFTLPTVPLAWMRTAMLRGADAPGNDRPGDARYSPGGNTPFGGRATSGAPQPEMAVAASRPLGQRAAMTQGESLVTRLTHRDGPATLAETTSLKRLFGEIAERQVSALSPISARPLPLPTLGMKSGPAGRERSGDWATSHSAETMTTLPLQPAAFGREASGRPEAFTGQRAPHTPAMPLPMRSGAETFVATADPLVIQRVATGGAAAAPAQQAQDSAPESGGGDEGGGGDVNEVASEVYTLLRRRLATEALRYGRR